MTTFAKLSIVLVLLITSCSCNFIPNGIAGKGPVKKINIPITNDFDSIEVSKGLQVMLQKSDKNTVTIEANENLLEIIDVQISNGTLVITSEKNIYKADAKKVYVNFDSINSIQVSSGARVTNTTTIQERTMRVYSSSGAHAKLQISSDHLSCKASSGAQITLTGYSNNLDITSSSGSNVNTEEIEASHIKAKASSGSTITAYSKKSLRAHASSGSSIRYSGNPEQVIKSDSSGGSIKKI